MAVMEDETAISRTIIKVDAKRQEAPVVIAIGALFVLLGIEDPRRWVAEGLASYKGFVAERALDESTQNDLTHICQLIRGFWPDPITRH